MNLDHLASIPPKKRRSHIGGDWRSTLSLYRSPRFIRLWLFVYSVPLGASFFHYISTRSVPDSFIPLLIATGFSIGLVASLLEGFTDTNTGIFLRRYEPMRYWITILILSAGTALPLFIAILK
jgi:hypothetical protein